MFLEVKSATDGVQISVNSAHIVMLQPNAKQHGTFIYLTTGFAEVAETIEEIKSLLTTT
jgi:hypothetical protein